MAQLVETLRYKLELRGSIPIGVIRILYWLNLSGRIVALGSTQPLREMSTNGNSWGVNAAGATFKCWLSRNSGSLNLKERSGPVQAAIRIAWPLLFLKIRDTPNFVQIAIKYCIVILACLTMMDKGKLHLHIFTRKEDI